MSARLTAEEGAALVALARAAIEDRLFRNGALAAARRSVVITPALAAKRACFVTLHAPDAGGKLVLRGCIGSTEARLPAHEAAIASALDAAFDDPRFPQLSPEEHPGLVVSVSALTPFTPVPSEESIVPGRDGVVLTARGHRALFLPEVAEEQGWTRIELLEHLCRKADLPKNAWQGARLSTFRSEKFGERESGAARIQRP
jgi:AmmeMemoRadiSam system protein A